MGFLYCIPWVVGRSVVLWKVSPLTFLCPPIPSNTRNAAMFLFAPGQSRPCIKAPLCKGSCLRSRLRGCSSKGPGSGLPAWWGRSPLGVPFERAKGTKTRLGRSPLRTPLGYQAATASSLGSARHSCCGSWYCHHTRPPWAAGPTAWRFSCPGLPWKSGVPAAGSLTFDSWEQRLIRARPWQ